VLPTVVKALVRGECPQFKRTLALPEPTRAYCLHSVLHTPPWSSEFAPRTAAASPPRRPPPHHPRQDQVQKTSKSGASSVRRCSRKSLVSDGPENRPNFGVSPPRPAGKNALAGILERRRFSVRSLGLFWMAEPMYLALTFSAQNGLSVGSPRAMILPGPSVP